MSVLELDSPQLVMSRLTDIERDLAGRQNAYEAAARDWFTARREIEREKARALLSADEKSVTEKRARAELASLTADGFEHEAEYEALRAVIRVLETRATICMSILKAQSQVAMT